MGRRRRRHRHRCCHRRRYHHCHCHQHCHRHRRVICDEDFVLKFLYCLIKRNELEEALRLRLYNLKTMQLGKN